VNIHAKRDEAGVPDAVSMPAGNFETSIASKNSADERDEQSTDVSLPSSTLALYRASPALATFSKNSAGGDDSDSIRYDTATLSGLLASLKRLDDQFTVILIDPPGMHFVPGGIVYQDRYFRMDEAAKARVFSEVGSSAYLKKHSDAFQSAILTEHAIRGQFGFKADLVVRIDQIVTLLKDNHLLALEYAAVLSAVIKALGEAADNLIIHRVEFDDFHFEVILISPSQAIEVRRGDVVQSGLRIVHHRFGGPATVVEAFIYRLVCTNGMTRRICIREDPSSRSRARKLPAHFATARERQMNQISGLTERVWAGLQAKLDAFKTTNERPAHVVNLLTRFLERALLSPNKLMPSLRRAWNDEGSENTIFAAVNALSNVATHDQEVPVRQRRALAVLAGFLAFQKDHLCDRCLSILAGPALDNQDR